MTTEETVRKLWPELEWIEDRELRDKVTKTWSYALEHSALTAADLETIPFTLLARDVPSFMAHKRAVVHIARDAALAMKRFFGDKLAIDMDTLIAGAILIDVGKLLEYVKKGEETVTSRTGKYLRHPFTGVAIAHRCGVPDEVCHMIATHAKEGGLGLRSTESWIVHHADFLSFEPFRERLR
ncbi:MAG: HDIG domain-containing metalloprotein [Planctomycetota bacterium]